MRITMANLTGEKQSVLAGAPNGRRALAILSELTSPEPPAAEPVYLDFAGVEIATASFLREAVLSFRDKVRARRSNLYPIVANANDLVLEELTLLIAPNGDALMTCFLSDEDAPSRPALVGDLDPKQRLTFDLVNRSGETDASELMRTHGAAEGVKQTAWNNRLSALAALGLVFELSQGRSKRYKPLFGGSGNGN